jgi:beta-glucosidase
VTVSSRFVSDSRALFLAAVSVFAGSGASAQSAMPYRDAKLPTDQRVADLLSRMTLEEKVAQLEGAWENKQFFSDPRNLFVDEKGVFVPERAAALLKNGIGEISRPSEHRDPRAMVEFTNAVQKWVKENTRLGIPVLFHDECLHGHVAPKGTSYPQAIALASTWDPSLLHEVFTATASEARARGVQQCLAPVLDLARDPRWGRTEETYGEDPYLVSRLGVAAITGYQGVGPGIDKAHVMATAKHFAVHGQPEGGTNVGPANYSERTIREYWLKPFEAAVKEAHVATVMPSYNEIDGIPSHSNKHLLLDILRHEWGFQGLITSDYFGPTELRTVHHVVANEEDAGRLAFESGVDVELPFNQAYGSLVDQVKAGKVSESAVDRSVTRVLRAKFTAGLFDDPYANGDYAEKITNSPEHQLLADQDCRGRQDGSPARTPQFHQLHRRTRACDFGWLVSWPRRRHRRGGCPFRRLQPWRQTADHDSAIRWTASGLLLSETIRKARIFGQHRSAALSLWLGTQLFDVQICKPSCHPGFDWAARPRDHFGRGHQFQRRSRRRSRAALHS